MNVPLVWVISPHAATRQMLGLNLSKRGLRTLEAAQLSELRADDALPQLIVVDIEPPDESGWAVVDAARQMPALRRVPLVLLVTHAPTMGRLLALRPARWVQKPTDTDILLSEIWKSLPQRLGRSEMVTSSTTLADRVRAIPGGEHLYMCYSCGTCVGSCMLQLTGEVSYNPRRLIQKVLNGLEGEAFEDRTTWLCSSCDLCYPRCPQQIHVSEVLGAIRALAIEAGYKTTIETAVVDEGTCVACGLCVEVCPYEAISLVERRIAGRARTVAEVDTGRCMACGLCAASCRSASIELPDAFSNESVVTDMWEWMIETAPTAIPVERVPEWSETVPSSASD
jgi:heterodisulfide reductase subunit C/CheY-like chemotaxis protein